MAITHIVLFAWKETTTKAQVDEICRALIALSEKCVRPTSKEPYVKGLKGGKNALPELFSVRALYSRLCMEFDNQEDLDYYTNEDPAHRAFSKFVQEFVADFKGADFQPGVF
ncbi:hypothetical protein CC80DRAFT_398404 [Byssothecium circinans]|uniref:Stress-response A/B barrel domain-containing protein n=1 Tax=Byssothecium circinans TaxID=147558 RepID=A0A6A5UPP3_9PLEO|nr:hypothetical protein CC80DRAFT_398404 [Byssothecium circinans]